MKKLFLILLLAVAPSLLLAQGAGFANYRNTALSSTKSAVKSFQASVFGYTLINPNTVPVYVKFYNATVANTTVGTTVPQSIIMIPPGDSTSPGVVYLSPDTVSYQFFQLACTIAAVTGRADNSTAAPSTAIYVEVLYK